MANRPGLSERGSKTSATPVKKQNDKTALSPKSSTEETTMPRKDNKVRGWNRKDVSRWLEKINLVKFVPLFLRNGIVGADLVESRLSFLYEEGVGVEDREQLLAEIYMLLHPDSPKLVRRSPPSPSLRPIHPRDREKYEAAVQVAKSPTTNSSSAPVVMIGSRGRPPALTSSSSTTLTLPASKPRSRSESGLEAEAEAAGGLASPSPGRKYLKRKSTPAVHDYLQRGTIHNAPLYHTLQNEGQVCLHCVKVQRSEVGSKFGFSYQTLPDSCLLVTNIKPSSSIPLQIGDKILEVNGILLPGHKGSTVETVLSKSPSLDVVVVRHLSREPEDSEDSRTTSNQSEKLQQELIMGEVRWQSLRQLLTSLQQKSFDPMTLTGALGKVDDMEDMKTRAVLEMEMEELQRTCTDLSNKVNSLQVTLKTKEQELLSMKTERDRAVDTLRKRFLKQCGPPSSSSRHHRGAGGYISDVDDDEEEEDGIPRRSRTVETSQDLHAVFFEHIDVSLATMEASNTSKEEVLAALRELTQASRRHAQFVDRVISFVSERAPWMIDELNALQDASELPDTVGPAVPLTTSPAKPTTECDAERVIVV